MAIIRLAQPFDAFHGTVSGQSGDSKLVLFSTAKAAGVSRQWVSPANPQTTPQNTIRGYQTASTNAYSALTPAQAAAWTAAAAEINRTNILNLGYTLSGINLFVSLNSYRQINGVALVSDVPPIVIPPIPAGVDSADLSVATTLDIIIDLPGSSAGYLCVLRISPPLPSAVRQARRNDVRLADDFTQSIVVQSGNKGTFALTIPSGFIEENDYIGIEARQLSSSYVPGPVLLTGSFQVTSSI